MRLKHRQNPLPADRLGRLQRRANFGRMMSIIIDKQKTIAFVFDFETAARVLKFAKRAGNLFERNTELGRERDYTERVVDVVLTGNI